jgi:pyruvate, water dikinase
MSTADNYLSTGLPSLDRVLGGLMPGDNVVWHVDTDEDYRAFVKPLCDSALSHGAQLVYFHFAKGTPLVTESEGAQVCMLQPELGFESFISEIHRVIQENAPRGVYVFDSLSELADDWFSDQMLTNFFLLTCPYIYDIGGLAYFAVRSMHHSLHVRGPIGQTAQILIDVYRHRDRLYLQPIKVQQRHSGEMYALHAWEGDEFHPVTESGIISEILTFCAWEGGDYGSQVRGVYRRAFRQAEELMQRVESGELPEERAVEGARDLLRRVVTRDDRFLDLCLRHMSLSDVLAIQKRMIGTGQIGGKAVGMLLARAILRRSDPRWSRLLEAHDSFFVGSDVFYTFLVENGCWWERQRQKSPTEFLEGEERVQQTILRGHFPEFIMKQFSDMIDYFGQSPIIVRSSSLLEDSFGHPFTGKYESVFCANQGDHHTRLLNFLNAVRAVYASCMSEKALAYRAKRGLLDQDEQMALLVQRVSGAMYGKYFHPQLAGVAFSHNPYVWSKEIDPTAGVVRLVFGMGTRAVNRSDDDYTRIIALNAPDRRPETSFNEVLKHAQRKVDVLDLDANRLVTEELETAVQGRTSFPRDLFLSRDEAMMRHASECGQRVAFPWFLTFERLLTDSDFVLDMRQLLKTLEDVYEHPVDVEFTANFLAPDRCKINVVQCRPFQVQRELAAPLDSMPHDIPADDLILEAQGAVIGPSQTLRVDRLICVMPSAYGQLPVSERSQIARLIGELTRLEEPRKPETVMLIGPGRWGTRVPSLGVPVSFAEISPISILCELVTMGENVVPDVSLGAHFFNELVEMDILYLALFPGKEDNQLNERFLRETRNRLTEMLPGTERHSETIRVIDSEDLPGGCTIRLHADAVEQRVCCHLERKP